MPQPHQVRRAEYTCTHTHMFFSFRADWGKIELRLTSLFSSALKVVGFSKQALKGGKLGLSGT